MQLAGVRRSRAMTLIGHSSLRISQRFLHDAASMTTQKPMQSDFIIGPDDSILGDGSRWFHWPGRGPAAIASRLPQRARVCPAIERCQLDSKPWRTACRDEAQLEVIRGNLLSREDCTHGDEGCVGHLSTLATSTDKSFANAFMNSVVTTSNLLDSCLQHPICGDSSISAHSRFIPIHESLAGGCWMNHHL